MFAVGSLCGKSGATRATEAGSASAARPSTLYTATRQTKLLVSTVTMRAADQSSTREHLRYIKSTGATHRLRLLPHILAPPSPPPATPHPENLLPLEFLSDCQIASLCPPSPLPSLLLPFPEQTPLRYNFALIRHHPTCLTFPDTPDHYFALCLTTPHLILTRPAISFTRHNPNSSSPLQFGIISRGGQSAIENQQPDRISLHLATVRPAPPVLASHHRLPICRRHQTSHRPYHPYRPHHHPASSGRTACERQLREDAKEIPHRTPMMTEQHVIFAIFPISSIR
ncbi:hypothetical protein E2C01_002956 [Portunus trituberculatus]|uniref:Uncharacterized protein n=1 Tax=Portunus trituberculatus TaxID=210409 RepID=A0A5B7CNA0_PORTR|nr:hypothetical protein [Portunus trituberculatus]